MPVDIPKDNWPGTVRTVTVGATAADGGTRTSTVTVGGEKNLPFLHFETKAPNRPAVAIEIKDHRPDDWSQLLLDAWGEHGNNLLVAIAEATKGERLVLGIAEDKNYRTIIATAMANGHLVNARSPMDVNLAKQLNILISDMGMPLDLVLMDPTTGALGYGIEYGFSAMERLRQAALQGDAMTQLPMLVTPGYETWKTKEAKVETGGPAAWGDELERSINWETLTAMTLIEAGADIVVLRHAESVRRIKLAVAELML